MLILLLTILPIQYSWSMAAVYCQHEASKVAHFGHHGHEHQAQAGDEDGGKLSKHGDCEVCHHAVQASAPFAEAVLTAAPAVDPRRRARCITTPTLPTGRRGPTGSSLPERGEA
ncbi:DUF2946 family protein [Duganella sp. P38]|uniref:DUF2946 family protein n=1 Tax=Duganella sp. P38 TaxID=3423949 RepID=UPI003D7AD458